MPDYNADDSIWIDFLPLDSEGNLEITLTAELDAALHRLSTMLLDDIYDAVSNCGLIDETDYNTPRDAYRAYLINALISLALEPEPKIDLTTYAISFDYHYPQMRADLMLAKPAEAFTAIIEYCAEQTERRYFPNNFN